MIDHPGAPQDRPERTPQRFRKKPIVIEAVKVVYQEMLANGPEGPPVENPPQWFIEAVERGVVTLSTRGARDYAVLDIHTLEGTMEATPGDWIIRGIKGELYPCQPDVFDATYEPDVAVPARAHQEENEHEMPDDLARSGTTEIRDRQPAAVTEAGDQSDCAGTETRR